MGIGSFLSFLEKSTFIFDRILSCDNVAFNLLYNIEIIIYIFWYSTAYQEKTMQENV